MQTPVQRTRLRTHAAALVAAALGFSLAAPSAPTRTPLEPFLPVQGLPQAAPRGPLGGGSPGGLPAPAVSADAQPTLSLLVQVLGLRDLLRGGQLVLDAGVRQRLGVILTDLQAAATLGPAASARVQAQVLSVLTPAQRRGLGAYLQAREARVRALLLRARVPLPGGPASPARQALNLLIPGGAALVAAVEAQPTLNPYRSEGANREILGALLTLLGP